MSNIYKSCGIYRITNKTTGKTYIGQTSKNFGDRWGCHRAQLNGGYHDNKDLQKDWNSYGADDFEFDIVEEVENPFLLDELEKKYISQYKETGLAYNIDKGGAHGAIGRHLSDEIKRQIGDKNRANMTGKKASEETRRKMSESHKRFYTNMANCEREKFFDGIGEWNKGKKWSDEQRKKFSDTQRVRPNGSKYTIEDVREIRRLHEECGLGYPEIAEITGIKRATVYGIATYKRWKYAT